MPVQLFQQTTPNYPDTEIDTNALLRSVQFAVSAPYSALYQIAKKNANGQPVWDKNDLVAQPGQGGFQQNIYGIRFKSFDPVHPTTVLCKAFFEDDPVPTGDLASTSTFNTGGQVSPGGSSVEVDRNGVLVGTEPKLNIIDPFGAWNIADNPGQSRIDFTPNYPVKFLDYIPGVNIAMLDTAVILGGNIPQVFSYIEFILVAESALAAAIDNVKVRMNGLADANYQYTNVRGTNNVPSSGFSAGDTAWLAGLCNGAGLVNWSNVIKTTFPWYRSGKLKSMESVGGFAGNNAATGQIDAVAGIYLGGVPAITSIQFFLASGSNLVANATRLIGYGYP